MDKQKIVAAAQRYIKKGQFKKAITEVERLVANDEGDMRARLELADLFLRTNEPARAADTYKSVAKRYERDGFGLKALGVYLQIAKIAPQDHGAHVALGRHYAQHGLLSEASARFTRALSCVPKSAGAQGRLEVIQQVLELDLDNLAGRLHLAEALSAAGDLKGAVREFRTVATALDARAAETDYQVVAERLLYHQSDDSKVAKKLANYYVSIEEPQRALAKLQKAYAALPNDLEILGLLADTFNQLGQVHKSVMVLREMGRLYDDNGLTEERDECHTRILMLDPNDLAAREALGEAKSEAEGQTLEFSHEPVPVRSRMTTRRGVRLPPSTVDGGAATFAVPADGLISAGFDYDDDEDDDDDEIGFGEPAENTIVDDAFIPDDVRESLAPSVGFSLEVPGSATASGGALQEDIRELDFYLQNGLAEEAASMLAELLERHGEHPSLDRRAAAVERLRG